MASPTQQQPYPLRMPESLRDAIAERAKKNGRSLNAEIVALLQAAVDSQQAPFDADTFAEDLAERIARKLKATE